MPSPLYQQLQPAQGPNNSILKQFLEFKKNFTGDPKQIVQNMINSGRISQAQVNQYAQQANELYRQFNGMLTRS